MSKDKNKESEGIVSKKLLDIRSIVISKSIDGDLADKVIKGLLVLEEMDKDAEIKIFINSAGGEVSSGLAIFDMLKFVSCPVSVSVCGLAASMASVILQAASEGKRLAFPNARIMIHQPLITGAQGHATDLEIHSKEILKTRKLIAEFYKERSKKNARQILKDMDRDYWLSAEEALEYGLIDKIISQRSDLA